MILFHPLQANNELAKLTAIEKYKDRLVYVRIGRFDLWLTNNPSAWWQTKENRKTITFKEALKLTKSFGEHSKIEYHFIPINGNVLGEEKPDIKDFDEEDVYNCPTISFEKSSRIGND